MNHFVSLHSGGVFFFDHPSNSTYTIQDIAWSLAHINRFNGHVNERMSVAQHCVNASYLVPRDQALAALFHDAAEAFLGDITTPLKAVLGNAFRELEKRIEAAVFGRLNINPYTPEIKQADVVCTQTERRVLFPQSLQHDWGQYVSGVKPLEAEEISHEWPLFRIGGTKNLSPEHDYNIFMVRYMELTHVP